MDSLITYIESLGANAYDVDPEVLKSLADRWDAGERDFLYKEDELNVLATDAGELVLDLNAPRTDERDEILRYAGERLTALDAKLAGHVAERDVWLKKIDATYGRKIKQTENVKKGILWRYRQMGRAYLDDLRAKNSKPPMSASIGLLVLKYTTRRNKTEVDDPLVAVPYIKDLIKNEVVPGEALKVEESVLHSHIPDAVKAALPPESGIVFTPGGDLEFEIA